MDSKPRENSVLAHVAQKMDGGWGEHFLLDHLKDVANLAGKFAAEFGNGDWASLAGLWHDLGKYSADFQNYIRSASGFEADAHIENVPGRVNHSSAGALHAVQKFGDLGRILAYCIAGHHAGLADWHAVEQGEGALSQRLQKTDLLLDALNSLPPEEILNQSSPNSKPPGQLPHLWIRMLFSCLVDADFLDTERFMDAGKASLRSQYFEIRDLLNKYDQFMKKNFPDKKDTDVNRIRSQVLHQCRQKALDSPGLFSLTVPTGGGKTLSSMAFALNHAVVHGKRRVIYVIPYTSILEQTAKQFKNIFGDSVVEHHSNVEFEQETTKSRLACENWDAPVIVTTNVQFFESLYAARTSRARKVHNIINSVVILDEAQLVPPDFLNPILSVIKELNSHYGVSFVLCTATQPAWNKRKGFDWEFPGLSGIKEIVQNPHSLYQQLKRVKVELPDDFNIGQDWDSVAQELAKHESALCIVNTRKDCRALFKLMPEGTYHLSALMCAEHRSKVIKEIQDRLHNQDPIRVISTQLVEAGVDLDFPVVYRAVAGLDSIAQAAGRCNREGKLPSGMLGKVVVFVPPKNPPPGLLSQAASTSKQVLIVEKKDPLTPEIQKQYFEQLYWKRGQDLDRKRILNDLDAGPNLEIQFRTAAMKFRLIDEDYQNPVIVRYGKSNELIGQLKKSGPERYLMRQLQRYIINIPKPLHQILVARGDLEEIYKGIYVQTHPALYHDKLGFVGGEENLQDPTRYIH